MALTFTLLSAPAAQPALAVLLLSLGVATVTDLRARRIPNCTATFASCVEIFMQ